MRLSNSPRFVVGVLAGNKYGFRSGYIPIIRQLKGAASIHVYLLDFPKDDHIGPSLEELRNSGLIDSYHLIPDNQRWLSHQRALAGIGLDLKQKEPDVLIVDSDITPMHQYFIKIAHSVQALVFGVLKEVPVTIISYYAAISGDTESPTALKFNADQYFSGRRFVRRIGLLAKRPGFITSLLLARCKRAFKLAAIYWALPLVYSGRVFKIPGKYEAAGHFSSSEVDAAIVYNQETKQAIEHFFPWANVILAQHPLAQNCRCDGNSSKTKLLVALGAPWVHWIAQDNTVDMIEERWFQAIKKSVDLQGFTSVDIRPHPRETVDHAHRLALRLVETGISAQVRNTANQSLPEIMCDYAGIISSPSSVLDEAINSCRRAFAIGIKDLNQVNYPIAFEAAVKGVVWKTTISDLTKDDFESATVESTSSPTVANVIENLLALKKGSPQRAKVAAL